MRSRGDPSPSSSACNIVEIVEPIPFNPKSTYKDSGMHKPLMNADS